MLDYLSSLRIVERGVAIQPVVDRGHHRDILCSEHEYWLVVTYFGETGIVVLISHSYRTFL